MPSTRSLIVSAGLAAFVSGCTTAATPSVTADQLPGSSWRVFGLNGGGVQSFQLTINFEAGGRVVGSAPCNDYRSVYSQQGRRLRFGTTVALTTDRICDQDTIETEERFLATLGEVRDVAIAPSGSLVLYGGKDMRIVARRI